MTNTHAIETRVRRQRRRTKAERQAIVEQTLLPGASVSQVARRHDVTAKQVFHWRKLYHRRRLRATTGLLPLTVAKELSAEAAKQEDLVPSSGILEAELAKGALRISGSVDALSVVLEALVG